MAPWVAAAIVAPALPQLRVTFQGFVLDGNAAEGFASTAGLTMIVL